MLAEKREWNDSLDEYFEAELRKGQQCCVCQAMAEKVLPFVDDKNGDGPIIENCKVVRNEIVAGYEFYCLVHYKALIE